MHSLLTSIKPSELLQFLIGKTEQSNGNNL